VTRIISAQTALRRRFLIAVAPEIGVVTVVHFCHPPVTGKTAVPASGPLTVSR
jgi:hypothetical protein